MRIRPSALVIEDDAYAQRLIGAVADRAGFTVTAAGTGADAEKFADTLPFDIIVVDLNLPDTQGLSLIESLRARPHLNEVPFVVCSGNVNMENVTGAARLGALEFMKKPIDLVELQRRLERSYDMLTLRWSAPTPHRTVEDRQGATEALARARRHLITVIGILDPAGVTPASAADDAPTLEEAPAVAADVSSSQPPVTHENADDDADGDEPDELALEDLLEVLQADAATIGSPRFVQILEETAVHSRDDARRAQLVVALRVALKSLDMRMEA